jgi:hypothetical protein
MLSFHGVLIEEFFDFHFPLTDPVRFIPMQLSFALSSILKANESKAFAFANGLARNSCADVRDLEFDFQLRLLRCL